MADDLPAVLELLHESHRRWRTLRADGDQWADPERSREAFMRNRPPGSVTSLRGGSGPARIDPTWKLWMDPPRFRADFGAPHETRILLIGDGRRVCASHPPDNHMRVSEQHDERPHFGPATALLSSYSLPGVLHLEVDGRRTSLGREVFLVRGRPRPEAERRGPMVLLGADEVEFGLDAERGVLHWMEYRLDGEPYQRVGMTAVAFDEDLDAALFGFPDASDFPEEALAVPGERRRPWAPHPRQGPPEDVLGQPVAGHHVIARTDTMVVAADRMVAYPTGFELALTIRTNDRPEHGSFDDQRHRAWSGVAAFPGESVRVSVVFADGRRGAVENFASAPAGEVQLVPIGGHGTQTRFDQRFWVEPLPPPGPLAVVVAWERRGLAETRADLDAGAIIEAARKAEALWP